MRLIFFFFISLFFVEFPTTSVASRPATKAIFYRKSIVLDSSFKLERAEKSIILFKDSVQTENEIFPEKPKKNGLAMIIIGIFLALLGAVFGVGLLLTFLLGFSIGSVFYFRDIYAIAGVMLGGLIIFGIGIYIISRGKERWQAYKRYRKEIKKVKKTQ